MLARHIVHQGPMIKTVLRTTVAVLMGPLRRVRPVPDQLPAPPWAAVLPPLPGALMDDFITHLGGDAASYRDHVPPHLFPQWCLPVAGKVTKDLPYSMARMLNAGCRIQVNSPLGRGEALHVRAHLESIDEDASRAIVQVRLVTGTVSQPDALVCDLDILFPAKRKGVRRGKEKPRISADTREIDRWRLSRRSGMQFALLTGDFNPVHWVGWYARLSGFRNVILHGFGTMAHLVETLNRRVLDGRPGRLRTLELRFTRPLVLPAAPAVFTGADGAVYVGDAPGEIPYAMGRYTTSEE